MFNNQVNANNQIQNDINVYPTLDNVLDNNLINNNNYNQMNNINFNVNTNTASAQSQIKNMNLNNFNSGVGVNMGTSFNNKRSSGINLKNINGDFENILNNSRQNPKSNKDSDPFEGYY